jgi:hypothetical protein
MKKLALLVGVSALVFAAACSDTPATGSSSGAAADGGTTTSSSGSTSGGSTTSSGGTDAGGDAATTLYDRLNKKAGIAGAVDLIVAEELKDPGIAAFFAKVGMGTGPSVPQLKECLVNQLGAAAGGPKAEVDYPTTVTGGYQCRDMVTAHTGLKIDKASFDKFVMIAAGVLKTAKVADADIATIGTVLNGTEKDIVGK